jgi:alkanesulfonate monooxygenase SsuD/methylene tetrahydromethanopterin reductase-like flavin-dependent oxidoreductase (luciferase family)
VTNYLKEKAMAETAEAATPTHPWVAQTQGRMHFGVGGGPMGDWPGLRDFVQAAEALRFDSYWRPDHPTLLPDCWTTLAAIAECTHRLRLGSMVTPPMYRNVLLLARIVADVDRISGGRVVLGLGAGDMPAEFSAMGLPFPPVRERLAALAEVLQTIPRLLRGETVSHAGRYFILEEAKLMQLPAQQPYVPLLVAGGGERVSLRLVAQYADVSNMVAAEWGGGAFTPEDTRRKYAVLREHCEAVGRPFDSILRTFEIVPTILGDTPAALEAKRQRVPPHLLAFAGQAALVGTPEQAVERLRPLVQVGVQGFIFGVLEPDTLRLLAERVIPVLSAVPQTV